MAPAAPDVLIVGPVTWDVFDGDRRPGGAVLFAAQVCTSMGVRAAVLTIAGPNADLSGLDGHEVRVVPADSTLTFEHRTVDGERELRVLERAQPVRPRPSPGAGRAGPLLTASDVPERWLDASDIVLAPLLPDDLGLELFLTRRGRVSILAQGLQRRLLTDGAVGTWETPADALMHSLSHDRSVFLSNAETDAWPPRGLGQVAAGVARVVVTRGREGATVYRADERIDVPAVAADVVDTTGAGDVFATAFILGLRLRDLDNEMPVRVSGGGPGLDDREAGRLASAYAAASVERVGPTALPPLSEITRRAGFAAGSVCA